jgi:hypothetical protein
MKRLKGFFFKTFIIGLPLLLILCVYFITDPFKVLRTYHFDDYYDWQHWELNREMVGTSSFKERLAKNDIPDAYVFGNSRSLVFRTDVWESFLQDNTKPFHFDAASESLFGVYHKVKYLDSKNIKIKDALLVCDISLLTKTVNDRDVTHVKQPDISGESYYAYQTTFIKGYFTNFFFLKQIDYLLFKKERNYMKDIFAIEKGYIHNVPYTNDYYYQKYDNMLRSDSTGYYVFKKDVFYERPVVQEASDTVLKGKQIEMLKEIKAIFDKDGTRFKIVISPLYDQKKINEADVKTLTSVFGANVVYDYSGVNDITRTKSNYYESSHFKPYIASKILTDIYAF